MNGARRASLVLCLILAAASLHASSPRLVVVLVIDQFRPDYLSRSSRWLLPARQDGKLGGFRLLMEEGAAYWHASYSSLATFTCSGHATLLSGANPADHGVIANTWFDRRTGRRVGCVDDPDSPLQGVARSPRSMLASTVGDELKFANQGRSKVVGLAFKDYAAMTLAGRRADLALWFDGRSGEWVSNPYYTGENGLPQWTRQLNEEKIPDRWAGKPWTPLLAEDAYSDSDSTPVFAGVVKPEAGLSDAKGPYGLGWKFPHWLAAGPRFYAAFQASGFANDFTVESAKRAIEGEKLGEDDAPDILAVSFSSNDKAGHYFGPDSPETLDLTVRTDRALAELFNYLDEKIGLGNVVVALTADHGVQNIPEELLAAKSAGGRIPAEILRAAAEEALDEEFGEEDWIRHVGDLEVYFAPELSEDELYDAAEVETVAAAALEKVAGVHRAVARSDILAGRLPATDWAARVLRNFHPRRSGDIVLIFEPNHFRSETVVTTHGTQYPSNARVPLFLFGPGRVAAVRSFRPVDPKDLASTLSLILGVAYPSANSGNPLEEALAGFQPAGR